MADDKLKTGPEPPGPDRPGDAPVKEAPPIQEPPVQETDAPGKTQEPAAPGTGPALQAEQSVIPGMGEDNPARSALGEVVVDFDKINELMSQRQAAAHGAVDKLKAPATDKDGKYLIGGIGDAAFKSSIFGDLLSRRWLKDYFTSALPTPQRGPDVQLPIVGEGGTIQADGPLKLMIQNQGTGSTTTTSSVFTPDLNVGLGNTTGIGISSSVNDQFPVEKDHTDLMYASGLTTAGGSVVAATINDLRRAIALQRFYEISARAGSRYIETIMGHFHVRSSDARLQRPEYLGGGVTDINIGEVLQTSATDQTSPQGNMAGRGFGIGRSNQCTYRAEEHGYLFGIMSIIPEPYYYQGIDKEWTRQSRVDYYWPSFAHLGEQEIDKSELSVGTSDGETDTFGQLFGYAPRYAEYKFSKNIITGLLRGSLANWTFARKISDPNLNAAFLEIPQVNNPFAVQDEDTDKFIIWFSNDIRALRPMPFFGTPSI